MLRVGGFTPLSTTDWPDHLAAVVFVQGCPWRCVYCHNTELQARDGGQPGGWLHALGTLARRKGLIDGVVFSGGEPTLDPQLPDAIDAVRHLGFKVGLHTAGIYPAKLNAILPYLDWVGLDIKADFGDYESVTGIPQSGLPTWRSLQSLLQAVRQQGLALEVRTTYHPTLHSDAQMEALATSLAHMGVKEWVIQQMRDEGKASSPETWGTTSAPPSPALLDRLRATGLAITVR